MPRGFYIANFGCRASQSEGASIEEELRSAGADAVASPYDAGVVVINSCTVTEEADREARRTIRRIASRNPSAQIIVAGCYAQRAPAEAAALPGVRYVVGNSHKALAGALALKVLTERETEPGRAEVFCSSIFPSMELQPDGHIGSSGRTRAIVKVQDGCNAHCSFCIIPSVRGASRSMNPVDVVRQVQTLARSGYKEIVFSGIHLGTYGRDLQPKTSLFELICRTLDETPALERLRLSSIEPLEVTPEIVRRVAAEGRIARHFHIPLQSGSPRILRAMRRPYTPDRYRDLASDIRAQIEDAAIGADVMVGFPGETDEDFLRTYRLIEDAPLTYLHVFPYSPRPGTPAAAMPDHVPSRVSRMRSEALRRLIAARNEAFRLRMIGRRLPALVLQPEEALTGNFIRVRVPKELPVNEWAEVNITGLHGDGLAGDAECQSGKSRPTAMSNRLRSD